MGVAVNNQYIVRITSNGEITPDAIKRHLYSKLTGFWASLIGLKIFHMDVEEYVPPRPKIKMYPEK